MATRYIDLGNRPLRATKADQALFVDREPELKALMEAVTGRLNAVLVGERGSGKTSLLHRLVAESRTETTGVEVVRIDAHLAQSAARTLAAVADGLGVDAFPAPPLLQATAKLTGSRPSLNLPTDEDDPVALIDAIGRIGRRGHVVVALDGVSPGVAFTLFGRLRDEVWEQPTRWVLALDQEQFTSVVRPPADAFFERTIRVSPFDEHTVGAVLKKRGLAVSRDLAAAIARSARGNPRKILAAARELPPNPNDRFEAQRVTEAGQAKDAKLAALPPAARMLHDTMIALDRPVSASDKELLAQLQWTRPRAVAVLRQLEEAGLVEGGVERLPESGPGRPKRTFTLVTG